MDRMYIIAAEALSAAILYAVDEPLAALALSIFVVDFIITAIKWWKSYENN